jgi:hypothetical protein
MTLSAMRRFFARNSGVALSARAAVVAEVGFRARGFSGLGARFVRERPSCNGRLDYRGVR